MSTIKVTNVQNPSAASAAITLDTNGQATLNGLAYPTSGSLSGRSRIINGSMMIDQRNAGASVTLGSGTTYTLDRWFYFANAASKFTAQQNAGSVTPPTGFKNYLGLTVAAAVSITAGDYYLTAQRIEGFNVADLGWGAAGAQSVTISFWVRSSLTGTFGASVQNGASNRSYPFTYSINAANTWEYKTTTIPGDTSGTWASDNSGSLTLWFGLGVGSTLSGTAGSWSGSDFRSATGATSVVGTNGATFYITGVQLEAGSVATPFERRSYGQELSLCQRYYETGNYSIRYGISNASITAAVYTPVYYVTKRVTPTIAGTNDQGTFGTLDITTTMASVGRSTTVANNTNSGTFTASAEL
jgi:hypothetical protein